MPTLRMRLGGIPTRRAWSVGQMVTSVVCAVPARILRVVSLDEILSLEAGCARLFASSTPVIWPFSGKSTFTWLFHNSCTGKHALPDCKFPDGKGFVIQINLIWFDKGWQWRTHFSAGVDQCSAIPSIHVDSKRSISGSETYQTEESFVNWHVLGTKKSF